MRGDAIGSRLDRKRRRTDRVRMPPAACITDGGNMVDVDPETKKRNRRHVVILYPI
jgi:hypothetical protein